MAQQDQEPTVDDGVAALVHVFLGIAIVALVTSLALGIWIAAGGRF